MPLADELMLSMIRYCLPVFGSVRISEEETKNRSQKNIQIILNQMMRLLCGVTLKDKVSIKELLVRTGLLSYNQLTAQSILTTSWKIQNGMAPALLELFPRTIKHEGVVTKSQTRGDIQINMGMDKQTFAYQAAKIWNISTSEIRTAKTLVGAKKLIKCFVKTLPI